MKPYNVSTNDLTDASVTYLLFDVADSSALSTMNISAWKHDLSSNVRYVTTVHIAYASNPEVSYLYTFDGVTATADLYMALMGEDSAGKFATYVRNNADKVSKHVPNEPVEFLPARKTLVEAS